jgi:CRISPR/Cas system-associated endonuclease/helicase Cas3
VKTLPALEPVEFCGLAKVLSVPLTKESELLNFDKEEYEKLKDKESMQAVVSETLVPMDEVLEQMMDKYLGLTKRRRKEINQILKEIKKSRKVN